MIRIIFAFIVLTFAYGTASAQSEVSGSWTFSMDSPNGSVGADVTLVAAGESLTGEFDMGGGRKWPIEEGTISGGKIAFKINRDGSSMTYVMTGTVEGNAIAGIASAMGTEIEWSMSK